MTNYNYLIIGGGMTAAAAVDGIREVDPTGDIGMISTEPDAPYNRPPLSKALWKGRPLDSIWRKTEDKRVGMHLGREVKRIVLNEKCVVDDKGDVFTYEKLLYPLAADLDALHSTMIKLFTSARSRITGAFVHSPQPAADLPSSVAALSARKSPRRWP